MRDADQGSDQQTFNTMWGTMRVTPPTPASGGTWTNTLGASATLTVTGGTSVVLTLSLDGTVFNPLSLTGGKAVIPAGGIVLFVYVTPPTLSVST